MRGEGNGWQDPVTCDEGKGGRVTGTHAKGNREQVLVGTPSKGNGWRVARLVSMRVEGDSRQVVSACGKGDGRQVASARSKGNGW